MLQVFKSAYYRNGLSLQTCLLKAGLDPFGCSLQTALLFIIRPSLFVIRHLLKLSNVKISNTEHRMMNSEEKSSLL